MHPERLCAHADRICKTVLVVEQHDLTRPVRCFAVGECHAISDGRCPRKRDEALPNTGVTPEEIELPKPKPPPVKGPGFLWRHGGQLRQHELPDLRQRRHSRENRPQLRSLPPVEIVYVSLRAELFRQRERHRPKPPFPQRDSRLLRPRPPCLVPVVCDPYQLHPTGGELRDHIGCRRGGLPTSDTHSRNPFLVTRPYRRLAVHQVNDTVGTHMLQCRLEAVKVRCAALAARPPPVLRPSAVEVLHSEQGA